LTAIKAPPGQSRDAGGRIHIGRLPLLARRVPPPRCGLLKERAIMSMTVWQPVLKVPVSPERDHIRGPLDAPVTLLEYGDYECPFCGMAHPIVAAVRQQMGEQLRFVFRHFPLTTVHPYAELAAEAAEAAGAQKKFWPMHDTLYENQERLEPPALAAYAEALGLDLDLFTDDLQTHAHAPKVREDFMSGVRSGVNGTPTFFINGVRHDASWDFANLLRAVQSAASARAA
jgi:protein-disulfide isomerase